MKKRIGQIIAITALMLAILCCSQEKSNSTEIKPNETKRIPRSVKVRKSVLDDLINKDLRKHDDPSDPWRKVLISIRFKKLQVQKESLLNSLKHRDVSLQIKAAELLSLGGFHAGMTVLSQVATEKKNPFQKEALAKLENMFARLENDPNEYRFNEAEQVILLGTIIQFKTPVTEKILQRMLMEDDHAIEKALSEIIENNPDPAWIDFFLGKLLEAEADSELKYKLTLILMNSGSNKIENAFVDLLQDRAPWIGEMAAKGLGRIRSRKAVKKLCECLNDNEFWLRTAAAWALGEIRNSAAADPLSSALRDEVWMVRVEAARALGKMSAKSKESALLECLSDTDPVVRFEAAEALELLGWLPHANSERTLHAIAKRNWRNLKKIGIEAVPQLLESLKWEDGACRKEIVGLLALYHTPEAKAGIQKSAMDENRGVREAAYAALRKLGLPIHPEKSIPLFFERKNIKKRIKYLSDFMPDVAGKLSDLYNPYWLDRRSLPEFSKFSFVDVKDFDFLSGKHEYKIKFPDVNYDLFNKYAFNYSQDKKLCFFYECASYRIQGGKIHVGSDDVDFGFGLFDFKLGYGQRICFVGPSSILREFWMDNRIFAVLTSDRFLIENKEQITYFLEIYCVEENAVFSFKSSAQPFKYKEGIKL
jgi:HEAT repeat protein